jgi:Kdo-III transferase WaaZ
MNDLLYRIFLRLRYGSRRWHDRRFPPNFKLEKIDEKYAVCRWSGMELKVRLAGSLNSTQKGHGILLLSGPSVKDIGDPGKLSSFSVMCVNGSPILLNGGRFDHYHVVDKSYPFKYKDQFSNYVVSSQNFFVGLRLLKLLMEKADPIFLKKINICLYENYRKPFRKNKVDVTKEKDCSVLNNSICFSKNLTKGLFTSPTVAYSAIQILYNLGYEHVNIFGLDLTDSGRFYASDAGQSLDKHHRRIFMEMSLCSKIFSENNKNIINRSPKSALPAEIMPIGDIDSYFIKK